MIRSSTRKSISVRVPGISVLFALACAAFLVLAACAQKDPLIGKWETSQAEGGGKTIDKAQIEAMRMNMTLQLNEDKSFALVNPNNTSKGTWDFGKDAKKLSLKIDPAQSTEKNMQAMNFDSVEVSAGKSLKMSLAFGSNPILFTFIPAK